VLALLFVALLLAAWELYAASGRVDELILPAPSAVGTALWEDRGLLWDNFTVTAQAIGIGLLIAAAAGVLVAVALHESRTLRRALWPVLLGSQTIPIVLVAPLLVAWFGFDLRPRLVIVALVCFFPIAVAMVDGLASVDQEARKLLRSFGASRRQVLRFLELPAALPSLFTGARLAVGVAAIAAVLAETAGGEVRRGGLGRIIDVSIGQLETARAYAAVVVLTLFALALFAALALAERRLLPWASRPQGPLS
jgi:NitT/TauT family transport system permease protein/putative hydroxymethylpyrimidine transport system permease protein